MSRQRVAELFERAIEIAPENLPAWMADACEGDCALYGEVERLLRADGGDLHGDAVVDGFDRLADIAVPAVRLSRAAFDRRRRHGRSLARRTQPGEFDQRVVIKPLVYPTPGLLHRFRQERAKRFACAGLRSPPAICSCSK